MLLKIEGFCFYDDRGFFFLDLFVRGSLVESLCFNFVVFNFLIMVFLYVLNELSEDVVYML